MVSDIVYYLCDTKREIYSGIPWCYNSCCAAQSDGKLLFFNYWYQSIYLSNNFIFDWKLILHVTVNFDFTNFQHGSRIFILRSVIHVCSFHNYISQCMLALNFFYIWRQHWSSFVVGVTASSLKCCCRDSRNIRDIQVKLLESVLLPIVNAIALYSRTRNIKL